MKDIKSGKGLIRVQKNEFKGKFYVDIRKFYEDTDTGEWKPTRKGISLPVDLVEEVVKAINTTK